MKAPSALVMEMDGEKGVSGGGSRKTFLRCLRDGVGSCVSSTCCDSAPSCTSCNDCNSCEAVNAPALCCSRRYARKRAVSASRSSWLLASMRFQACSASSTAKAQPDA